MIKPRRNAVIQHRGTMIDPDGIMTLKKEKAKTEIKNRLLLGDILQKPVEKRD